MLSRLTIFQNNVLKTQLTSYMDKIYERNDQFVLKVRYSENKIMTQCSSENEVEAAGGCSLDKDDAVEYPAMF